MNFQIENPSHFLDLWPGLLTVLQEQIGVECYAAFNLFRCFGSVGKADLWDT